MKQDKGQNQLVIDWLVNGDPDRVFVSTDEGSITYRELTAEMGNDRGSTVTSLVPKLNLGSVLDIYRAISMGPVRISGGAGWFGHQLPEDVMTVLSTSGTTGIPKLVPLTVDNWKAAVEGSARHLGHTAHDIWLVAMPLHHVGGLSVLFRSSHVGGSVKLLSRFDAAAYSDALSEGVTIASVVPTMLRRVLDHDRRKYEGLKAVLVGGGPIPAGMLEEASERGLPVLPTYGMTETCAQVATLKPGSPLAYQADLLPGVEAMIGPDGRIALRGPQVFSGYLGEKSRRAEEWFVTGDDGALEDRTLQIFGRADDVIVTGGENVDPSAVESALACCPGVFDVMVVGVPSDEWGSAVVCLYVGTAQPSDVESWARSRLDSFQSPKQWRRVDSIPKTALGKPDRNRGRDYFASG